MPDLLVVTNAAAGSAHEAAVDAALDVLRGRADVEVVATASPDECAAVVAGRGGRRVVVCGVSAGATAAGWHVAVRVDGVELVDGGAKVLQVGIGLGRSVGGGSPLTPHTVLDDRLADVVVSEAVGPLARLGYGLRLRRGSHVDRPDVRTARGTEVEAIGEPFHYNADGEVRGPGERRVSTIDPRGWNLVAPVRPGNPLVRPGRAD